MDPLADISIFGHAVFSPSADRLVREILALGGPASTPDLWQFVTWDLSNDVYVIDDERLDIGSLERELTALRDRLEGKARANGWEVDHLLEQAHSAPGGE